MPRLVRLVSWNVNGFRAICDKADWSWFSHSTADVVALQETKAELAQVPEAHREPHGWEAHWLASRVKKGYSGVAVFARREEGQGTANHCGLSPLRVSQELPDPHLQGEGRLLHLEFAPFHFFNVYFPNGSQGPERLAYKMAFYEAFLHYAEGLRKEKPIVVCGDFNTAHRPIDLAHPAANAGNSGFLPEERAWMDSFVGAGYIDTFRQVHGDAPQHYSWWSYRQRARQSNAGWRIDYFFISAELLPALRDAWIETDILGSDHCPVGLALEIDA